MSKNKVVIVGCVGMGKNVVTQEIIKKFHEEIPGTVTVPDSLASGISSPITMVDELPPYICKDFIKESISKEGKWPTYAGYKKKGR